MTREEMKKKYSIENMIRSENDFSLEVYFGNMCNYNCSYCFDAYTRKKHWSNWNKEQTDKCLKFIEKNLKIFEKRWADEITTNEMFDELNKNNER